MNPNYRGIGPIKPIEEPRTDYPVFEAGDMVRLTEDHEDRDIGPRVALDLHAGILGTVKRDSDNNFGGAWVSFADQGIPFQVWIPKAKLEKVKR